MALPAALRTRLVAVGVPVRDTDGTAPAGLPVSMPGVRYDPRGLRPLVATLGAATRALEADLAGHFRPPYPTASGGAR